MSGTLTLDGADEPATPAYELLKSIAAPADLRLLERSQLPRLAAELRATRDKMAVSLGFLEQLLALMAAFIADPPARPAPPSATGATNAVQGGRGPAAEEH